MLNAHDSELELELENPTRNTKMKMRQNKKKTMNKRPTNEIYPRLIIYCVRCDNDGDDD